MHQVHRYLTNESEFLMSQSPLIMHLVFRLDIGGLETLLVDLINRFPFKNYRHVIVCLTGYTEFYRKIARHDVEIYSLKKKDGTDLKAHYRFWKLCRTLRPTILHSYNLPTIEYHLAAWCAGIPIRVHAEHGRDMSDPDGKNWKYRTLRQIMNPFIDAFVPVSRDLERWLIKTIGINNKKIFLINNGVDIDRFHVIERYRSLLPLEEASDEKYFVIGSVGRIQEIKNHSALIDAFCLLRKRNPACADRFRLMIVGDGPMLATLKQRVSQEHIADYVQMPGARDDIPVVLEEFSVFAMSSLAEGTPVVLLEAMACGLPIVATSVGGIPDLVLHEKTGILVEKGNVLAMVLGFERYFFDSNLRKSHSMAARRRIEESYSLGSMLDAYLDLYNGLCNQKLS